MTLYLPLERTEFHRATDDVFTAVKRYDEVRTYTIELTGLLGDGVEIDNVGWEERGAVLEGNSEPSVTSVEVTVSGLGELLGTIAADDGQTYEVLLRFVAPDGAAGPSDYP